MLHSYLHVCSVPALGLQEAFGGKIESVDDYDEMMDTWGELMEAGEYGAVLALLDAKLPPVPGIPPLDDFINWVRVPHSLGTSAEAALMRGCIVALSGHC